MALIAKKGESTFENVQPGTYVGRCYSVIDLWTQKIVSQYGEQMKHQVRISFELPDETRTFDGIEKPLSQHMTLTLSVNDKSQMYKIMKNWFWEIGDEFDVFQCIGKAGLLAIVNSPDGKYTNISMVSPLMKGQTCPDQFNETIKFDISEFDEKVFKSLSEKTRAKIAESHEYKEMMKKADKVEIDSELPF